MRIRTPGRGIALACVAALAACAEDDPRPNVLLISLDSVRADLLGTYGARLPHAPGVSPSPNLDRLAAEGVLYENARSTTSWTLPAHASLFTGEIELVHGVEQDGRTLPVETPTLAEILGRTGYRTYGVYSGPYLDPRYGFARGFERYEAGYGPDLAHAMEEAAQTRRRLDAIEPAAVRRMHEAVNEVARAERLLGQASHRDVSSARVTELALAELERAADDGRPFFLFAHYFDAHYDYAPPAPFDRAFDRDYRGALDGHDYIRDPGVSVLDPERPSGRLRIASDRDLEFLQAQYAGELAWIDDNLGRLFSELERLDLAKDTLVVVVGDHGDEFFEHGSIGHRRTLFEEVLRVPAILRLPGALAAGERRAEPLVLADVPREILRLAGLPSALHPPAPAAPPIARLVMPELTEIEFATAAGVQRVAGTRVRVVESFHDGELQLLRERSLVWSTEPLTPEHRSEFDLHAAEVQAREDLRWVDLAAHPGAPDEAWSTDFTEPRARAALLRFRASHAALAGRRAEPPALPDTDELVAALNGLGYGGQEARLGTLTSDELLLPPPGEHVLDGEAR